MKQDWNLTQWLFKFIKNRFNKAHNMIENRNQNIDLFNLSQKWYWNLLTDFVHVFEQAL